MWLMQQSHKLNFNWSKYTHWQFVTVNKNIFWFSDGRVTFHDENYLIVRSYVQYNKQTSQEQQFEIFIVII